MTELVAGVDTSTQSCKVVIREAETGALYLEKQEDVRRYSLILDYVRAQALGPAESRALIAQLARQTPD